MGNNSSVPPPEELRFRDGLPRAVFWNGEFVEPWEPYSTNKTLKEIGEFKRESRRVSRPTNVVVPQEPANLELIRNFNGEGLMATWIGHATLLVQMDGVTFLTDPVWSDRCSPLSSIGPMRYVPPAIAIEDLPNIDFIVISHNHYDHLDLATVKRFGNRVKWYVPLGLKEWFKDCRITNVEELDWWQEINFQNIRVICTPAKHWSSRGPTDRNKTLWCSWSFVGPSNRFFFNGDTAYCDVYKLVGSMYGPFDLAAIPIGAYEPKWFMQQHHVDPEQAVQIHIDLNSKRSIAIHWGTFPLALEQWDQPPELLKTFAKEKMLRDNEFFSVKIGQTWRKTDISTLTNDEIITESLSQNLK